MYAPLRTVLAVAVAQLSERLNIHCFRKKRLNWLLGAFAKSGRVTTSLVICLLSIRPHGTNRRPLHGLT